MEASARAPEDLYGLSLEEYLSRPTTDLELRELKSKVRGELRKDDRVASVVVEVDVPKADGSELTVRILVRPVDPTIGAFAMTFAVTSAGVVLLAIGRAAA